MLTVLYVVCAIWAGLLLVLTVFFDVWVYLRTKDLDFVLSVWMNRHKMLDQRLLPKQAALLRAIVLTERGLKYFFYFVIIPLYIVFIFKLIGAKNG